jgi:cytochrome subunit of sulfide dehydrogenase
MGLRPMVLALAAGPLVLVAHHGAAVEAVRGAQLAAMCAACHRLDGRDQGIPSIVGLEPEVLIDTMAAFRTGGRPGYIMHAVAISLSDEEVAAVAEYLATLESGSP